jgi:hypothetical protein
MQSPLREIAAIIGPAWLSGNRPTPQPHDCGGIWRRGERVAYNS